MKTVTLCLGFNKDAEEAAKVYVSLFNSVFGNSKILHTTRFSEKEIEALKKVPEMSEDIMPGPAGSAKGIRFILNGQEIFAFNGGGYFGKFNESTSLYVTCETQEQVDKLWAILSKDGIEQPCGWVKDTFGVSWQIAPAFVWEITEGTDEAKAERLNIALFGMKKIDIEILKKACQ